jgi:hypothetical protein
MGELGAGLPAPLRTLVARSWSFRAGVEADAEVQFHRLAQGLEAHGAPARLVQVAREAAADEARHRGLCEALARAYGAAPEPPASPPGPLAPAALGGREALAYAVVAHCCVAETESVATLTLLVPRAGSPEVKQALQAIARDEVHHAQLGWAALAWLRHLQPLGFLEAWLPAMLGPGAGPLFEPPTSGSEDPRLVLHGVLPALEKQEVFLEALEGVVLPGLERLGVSGASARAWVAERAGAPRTAGRS